MHIKRIKILAGLVIMALCSCNGGADKSQHMVFKGLYSFGPGVNSFKDCDSGHEFWVTDSTKQMELKYSQLKFEKPYEPVYVEVEGAKVHSNKEGLSLEYDSTVVVKKLIKITKEIPDDMCK